MRLEFKLFGKRITGIKAWIIFFLFFTLLFFILNVLKRPQRHIEHKDQADAALFGYYAFQGSKGPVIWEIFSVYKISPNKPDSLKFDTGRVYVKIIDPFTKKLIGQKELYKTLWEADQNFFKNLDYVFFQKGDSVLNGSEESGVQAFNIYSGERIMKNSDFEKTHGEFKDDPIKSTRTDESHRIFNLLTRSGKIYFYYPELDLLRLGREDLDPVIDTLKRKRFYFVHRNRSLLYMSERPQPFSTYGFLPYWELKEKPEWQIIPVNKNIYIQGEVLLDKEDYAVILYRRDTTEASEAFIEKLDKNGKSIWRNEDTVLKRVFHRHYQYNFGHSGQVYSFYTSPWFASIGIDLNSGKTTFRHRYTRFEK